MIRVLIETTSPVTGAGLESLLRGQPDLEVVSSIAEADVLLTDEIAESLDVAAAVPVVVLTEEGSTQEALRSGARAVLPRNSPRSQIVAAIHAAAAGLISIPADQSAFLSPVSVEHLPEALSPREMDVLEMLAEGLSNKEIAYRLTISEHTAKFHVNSILTKLNAGTRTEAVMRGIRTGLIKI